MKTNIFRIVLSTIFMVGIIISTATIAENIITTYADGQEGTKVPTGQSNDSLKEVIVPDTPVQVSQQAIICDGASKGAIIEGIFILQNKRNSLVRHMKRVKIALIEIDHLIKDLVYERQNLFEHFYRNKTQTKKANIIDRILIDLSVFYAEMLNIHLTKGIYPYYLKQLQFFIDDINSTIEYLVSGSNVAKFADIKLQIDKFDTILDILDEEYLLLKLVLEAENMKLACKKYKERIASRTNQLTLYESGVKNKDDIIYIEQKNLLNSSIKKLKKFLAKLITDYENKQEKIKSIKHNLMHYYDDYQHYNKRSLTKDTELDTINQNSEQPLQHYSLGWFIDAVENIRKKLNKNFNREDLV